MAVDRGPVGQPAPDVEQLDLVGVHDVEVGVGLPQGPDRTPAALGRGQGGRRLAPYVVPGVVEGMATMLEPVTVLRHEGHPSGHAAHRGRRGRGGHRRRRHDRRPGCRGARARHHRPREDRRLRRLDGPVGGWRLDPEQLRPAGGRPGQPGRGDARLPLRGDRRRGPEGAHRRVRGARPGDAGVRPRPLRRRLRVGAAVLRLLPRGHGGSRERTQRGAPAARRQHHRRRAGPPDQGVHQGAGRNGRHPGRLPQDQPGACARSAVRSPWPRCCCAASSPSPWARGCTAWAWR